MRLSWFVDWAWTEPAMLLSVAKIKVNVAGVTRLCLRFMFRPLGLDETLSYDDKERRGDVSAHGNCPTRSIGPDTPAKFLVPFLRREMMADRVHNLTSWIPSSVHGWIHCVDEGDVTVRIQNVSPI